MLDDYTYVSPLAVGRFAITKLYKDKKTGEKVAIKFIELDEDGEIPEVIKSEIDIFSKLSHPSIVKYIDSFKTEESLCIVMEYVSGGDLHGVVSEKRQLTESVVKNYMMQLLDALDYLQQQKISHKDIKLENILVSDDEKTIKLCDFGFSAHYDSEDITKKYGTPSYMPPELIQNRIEYPELLDVWSSGVLMYIMLFGFFPFEDRMRPDNLVLLMRNITKGNYFIPRMTKVSEDGLDFMMSMLMTNPRQRATIVDLQNHHWMNKSKRIQQSIFGKKHDVIESNCEIPLFSGRAWTTEVA